MRRLVALLLVVLTGTAYAAWTTTGGGTGSVSATTLNPPPSATATGASPTTVLVSVPAAPSTGAPPSGYRVDRTSPSAASGVCTITGSTGSCTAAASGTGAQTYSVVSLRGAFPAWTSTALTGVTGTPTGATPPTVAVSQPTAGQSFGNSGSMNNNCPSSTTGICGTAAAGSGTITSVVLTLQRTLGATVTFWSGSAWTSGSTSLAATGTTAWRYAIDYGQLRAGATGSASYSAVVTVTNSSAGTASTTRTFTTT